MSRKALNNMRKIYLIRHGQTYYNLMHRMQGWSDTPLTSEGIGQAVKAGKVLRKQHFPLHVIFSSDVNRAVTTAKMIEHGYQRSVPIEIDSGLREQFFGSYEGIQVSKVLKMVSKMMHVKSVDQYTRKYGLKAFQDVMAKQDPLHLAETDAQFWQRFSKAIMRILANVKGPVLIIGHSRVITALVAKYAPQLLDPLFPNNLSLTKVAIPENKFDPHVVYYNKKLL